MTSLLMLLNILAFLLVEITGGSENTAHMIECGASFVPKVIWEHQYFRLFTSMFLHFGMTHLANNMLALFVLGGRLETFVGKGRFLFLYLAGGLCGNILSIWREWATDKFTVSAGASGATFAILGALVYLIIRNKGHLGDLSVRQILIIAALSLYLGFTSSGVDNVAHVGGMLGGFFFAFLLYLPWVKTNRIHRTYY